MTHDTTAPGPQDGGSPWVADPGHRAWLALEAQRQFDFFRHSLRPDGGFDVLDRAGRPLAEAPQELHTTTRLVHSFALGAAAGGGDCASVIDAGMDFLWTRHRDTRHGGYVWSVSRGGRDGDGTKLAYGHVFVLLAASSALEIGHPDARRLLADVAEIIETRFWDDARGLLADEFRQDWTPFSGYRGMNANMHGAEAMLAAFEATGERVFLDRAGRILDFFIGAVAPAHGWRLPEHYHEDWTVDPDYRGNPMFRPHGTTPGHSFELARLHLQHWDLCGRPEGDVPHQARTLVMQALADAWLPDGGFAYTLDTRGKVAVPDRYWWPVTEAIGAIAALQRITPSSELEAWYRRLWAFAVAHFIDPEHGGWFPEIDAHGRPVANQFHGKPDIYHSVQAALLPLCRGLSRLCDALQTEARPVFPEKRAEQKHGMNTN